MFHVSNNVHGYNSPNPITPPVMCECVFPTMFHLSTKPVFCLTSMLLRWSITGRFKQPSLKPTAFAPQKKVGIFPDDKNLAVNSPVTLAPVTLQSIPPFPETFPYPPVMSSLTTSIGHCTSSKLGKTATNSSDAYGH